MRSPIRIQLISLMRIRIRIQLISLMRILILPFNLMRFHADPDPQHRPQEHKANVRYDFYFICFTFNFLFSFLQCECLAWPVRLFIEYPTCVSHPDSNNKLQLRTSSLYCTFHSPNIEGTGSQVL
jgi:hypothetical protein